MARCSASVMPRFSLNSTAGQRFFGNTAHGNQLIAGGQIRMRNLQVHGRMLLHFVPRMEQSGDGGPVIGAKAFLFAVNAVDA